MRAYIIFALVLATSIGLSSCNVLRAVVASSKSKTDFYACTTDDRIVCEPGSESLARTVAPYLPDAIETIARAQYSPFPKPIVIYTYATRDSYSAHTAQSVESAGSVVIETLNLSPKLLGQPERLRRILTHELSHLHLQQPIGVSAAGRIPSWFHEGLAVLVSNGGGAESISSEQALEAIRQGKHFTPEPSRSWFSQKNAADYGLDAHMYYRQAALFVGFLRSENPSAFENMMKAIAIKTKFVDAIQSAYGKPLEELWSTFLDKVNLTRR